MSLSKDEVKKIAKLAMLKLTEEEVEKLGGQISGIVDWVDMLQEVDTEGVEPTYQVTGINTVLRDDEVERYGDPDELLKNSPLEKKAYQVLVKKILNK
jgi:aspartyl-tRNA(Asn)/glutamyl-tRNA(Gln) amidotransferase subunit C